MLGISPQLHDLIFSIGALILFFALIPAVIHKSILPLSTCYITGGVLFIFALNYLTMKYWYATVVEAANVTAWTILFFRAWRANRAKNGTVVYEAA